MLAFTWFFLHMIPTFLFDASTFKMSNGGTNFVMGALFCFMAPALLVSFNTFAFLRYICFKLKIDNPQSVGKEFIPRSLLIEQEEKALAEQEEIELEQRRKEKAANRLDDDVD